MRKYRKLGRRYNWVVPRKGADGGRVSEGLIVATNAGNAAGVKEPCCSYASFQWEGTDDLTVASITVQDLRRRL